MFTDLLERLAHTLDDAGLPYMIIGGQAVLLYGDPRLTRDIDITLGVDVDRQADVAAAATKLGLTLLVNPESFTKQTMVLPCLDPATGIRVDFIFSFTPYERQAIERASLVPIHHAQVRFATAEDLIVHKMLAGRPRDLEDVTGILLKNRTLDSSYIRHWLGQFATAVHQPLVEQHKHRKDQQHPGNDPPAAAHATGDWRRRRPFDAQLAQQVLGSIHPHHS